MKVLCVVLSLCTLLAFSQAHPVNGTYPGGKCDDVRQQCNATLIGAFCPQCDSKGNFLPKQCSGSTGYCWCVDIFSGKEKENTRTPPGTKLNCGGKKRCPDGWTNHGDKCFIFIDTPKRWTDAEVYCRFDGANLASIHSDEENYFITSLTRGDTHDFPQSWLGGFDAIQPGFWLWSDGSEFSYENWHENEPYDDDDDDEEKEDDKDADDDHDEKDEGDEKDDDDEDEDDHDSDEKHHKHKKHSDEDDEDDDDSDEKHHKHMKHSDEDDEDDDSDEKHKKHSDEDDEDDDDSDEKHHKHKKHSDEDDEDDDSDEKHKKHSDEDDEDDDDSDEKHHKHKKHSDEDDEDDDDSDEKHHEHKKHSDEDDEDDDDSDEKHKKHSDEDDEDSDEKHHDDDKDNRNKKEKKNCLRINYEHGLKWFYAPCVDTLPFVCAKKADDDD